MSNCDNKLNTVIISLNSPFLFFLFIYSGFFLYFPLLERRKVMSDGNEHIQLKTPWTDENTTRQDIIYRSSYIKPMGTNLKEMHNMGKMILVINFSRSIIT